MQTGARFRATHSPWNRPAPLIFINTYRWHYANLPHMKTPLGFLDSLYVTLGAGIQAEITRAIATALRAVADQLDGGAAPRKRIGRPPKVINLDAPAPKRRGRPPASPFPLEEKDAAPAPKRRGRPPKNAAPAPEAATGATPAKLRALRAARAALAEKRRLAAEEQASPPVTA